MEPEDLSATLHGTMQGYRWHVRYKVISCEDCRQANAEYMESVRRGKGIGTERKPWYGSEEEICKKFAQGHSVAELAKEYHADRRTVNKIVGRGSMRGTRREAATKP